MRASRFALVLAVLAAILAGPMVILAQEGATLAIQSPVPVADADTFTTDVTIAGVEGLLGFQFDVNFDPAVLAVDSIALGPFLASTGRAPQPLGPDNRDAANGRVVFGGFTLGAPEVPGASGDGVLATITWRTLQSSETQVNLSRIQLAGSAGQALPSNPASEAAVTFQASSDAGGGSGLLGLSWPVWLVIALVVAAVAALAVILGRRRKARRGAPA